ncbi:spexin prohormone 2-like [Pungitius pungitius]|uniref:spexin prohormone 2-like n=1 Tax=Pungitius pungitius TaxID=134920 RepID=UPI002E151AD2
MQIKALVVWTCALVLSLLVGSCHPQKLNIHWGPQSMMYLKGKHGRRFVSEDDHSVLKPGLQGLQGWYALLRGIQKLQSPDISQPRHIVRSEKVLIHYLQER